MGLYVGPIIHDPWNLNRGPKFTQSPHFFLILLIIHLLCMWYEIFLSILIFIENSIFLVFPPQFTTAGLNCPQIKCTILWCAVYVE